MMIKKNRWVVNDESDAQRFPCWQATIPYQENGEKRQQTIRQVYNLAIEEKICRIVKQTEGSAMPKVLVDLTCLDFQHLSHRGSSYYYLVTNNGSNCEEQSLVSYYNSSGELVTEWIDDFYNFYRKLHPAKYSNPYGSDYYWKKQSHNLLPMIIEYHEQKNEVISEEIYQFKLTSDIWFPRVVGWLDSEEPSYDNSELAALNTPRLNSFLQRTKKLILSLGGKWELIREKPIVVKEYDVENNYYNHYMDPSKIIDTKIVYIDGIQKEVYPPLSNYRGVESIPIECQISENGISLEMDLKPRNRWCILANESSGFYRPEWKANFPAGRFATHQDAWPLIKTIVEVGQQEEIFRIFEEEAEFYRFISDIDSGVLPMPFLEVLHSGIAGTKVEDQLVTDNLPEYIRNIKGMTKVSYYEKDGQLVDKYLKERDLGRILYNYHLGSLGKYQNYYRNSFLHPYYGCLEFYDRLIPEYDPEGCYINITLASDIWFPVVDGSMERKVGIDIDFDADKRVYYQGGFDNRELANRHTPRLNRFLNAIANKVTEMGGEWSIGASVPPEYREKMTFTGIKLDV